MPRPHRTASCTYWRLPTKDSLPYSDVRGVRTSREAVNIGVVALREAVVTREALKMAKIRHRLARLMIATGYFLKVQEWRGTRFR